MLTENQLQERLGYVTGSDAATICGLSPYMNIIDLFLIKAGHKKQPDLSENPFIKAGNYLESVVRKMFEDSTGMIIIDSPDQRFLKSKRFQWMAGTIDGLIKIKGKDNDNQAEYAILECKTSQTYNGWGEIGDETRIPKHYFLQCAHYCAVAEANVCYIAVLFRGYDFRIYKYNRDLKIENKLIEHERIFWEENVLKGICPDPKTEQEVKSMLWEVSEDLCVADQDIEEVVIDYKILDANIDWSQKSLQKLRDKICSYMGNKQCLVDGFGKTMITWKESKPRKCLDAKKLMTSFPDIYDGCLFYGKSTRTFLIKNKD